MLALHEKELKYSRSTVPPVEVFRKWGPMMPAISINGESWFLESKEILHRLGYSPVTEEDMENIRKAWTGVMHRADYWPRFWGEFSLASDPNPKFVVRFIKNFFRAFTIMYFFTLIRSGVLIRGYRDPGCHADAYLTWEKRLAQENSPFLGGEIPDANDLLLFGIVQCHCSIPVPTVLELQTDTRLSFTRKWIGRMQSRFANYESLYSATYFPPLCRSRASNRYGAVCILVGEPFWIVCFPITLPAIGYFIVRTSLYGDLKDTQTQGNCRWTSCQRQQYPIFIQSNKETIFGEQSPFSKLSLTYLLRRNSYHDRCLPAPGCGFDAKLQPHDACVKPKLVTVSQYRKYAALN